MTSRVPRSCFHQYISSKGCTRKTCPFSHDCASSARPRPPYRTLTVSSPARRRDDRGAAAQAARRRRRVPVQGPSRPSSSLRSLAPSLIPFLPHRSSARPVTARTRRARTRCASRASSSRSSPPRPPAHVLTPRACPSRSCMFSQCVLVFLLPLQQDRLR